MLPATDLRPWPHFPDDSSASFFSGIGGMPADFI